MCALCIRLFFFFFSTRKKLTPIRVSQGQSRGLGGDEIPWTFSVAHTTSLPRNCIRVGCVLSIFLSGIITCQTMEKAQSRKVMNASCAVLSSHNSQLTSAHNAGCSPQWWTEVRSKPLWEMAILICTVVNSCTVLNNGKYNTLPCIGTTSGPFSFLFENFTHTLEESKWNTFG